jgi:hypothetical protein
MRTVTAASVAAGQERIEELPAAVMEVLGELAGAAREGLLALSVGVGLGVLHELMEAEVDEVVGPKGKHIADRTAVRHGHDAGEVTLGGRRVPVNRPRARSADGAEETSASSAPTSTRVRPGAALPGWDTFAVVVGGAVPASGLPAQLCCSHR